MKVENTSRTVRLFSILNSKLIEGEGQCATSWQLVMTRSWCFLWKWHDR